MVLDRDCLFSEFLMLKRENLILISKEFVYTRCRLGCGVFAQLGY